MIILIKTLWICLLVTYASSMEEMTIEEKRIENAMFAMAGEEPPHDVPLNHKDPTLHDMLVTSVKAVRESHVGHDPNETENETKHFDDHHNHQEHQHNAHDHGGHIMMMWFHFGHKEVILFDFWRIHDMKDLVISCVIIFVMGAFYEGLKWFRVYLTFIRKPQRKESFHLPTVITVTDGRALKEDFKVNAPLVNNSRSSTPEVNHPGPFSLMRIAQALLYIFQLVLAYWLMLIVMTYNVWLTFAVILGAGFGHWLFAALRFANLSGEAIDSIATDACH